MGMKAATSSGWNGAAWRWPVVMATLLGPVGGLAAEGDRITLFATGFEAHEGYVTEGQIGGQNGWLQVVLNTNQQDQPTVSVSGVANNLLENQGLHGFIGGPEVEAGTVVDSASLWHPVPYAPIEEGRPLVRFSVLMMTVWSSNERPFDDNFRWVVYNAELEPLCSVIFDNSNLQIGYSLGLGLPQDTGFNFELSTLYELEMELDYIANTWSAWLSGTQVVDDQPLAGSGQTLNLGDIDAVWVTADVDNPGDNYMVFDDYRITAEPLPTDPAPPTLLSLGTTSEGYYAFRLVGEERVRYAIEGSVDTTLWTAVKTNIVFDGSFDFVDTNAPTTGHRIFRARFVGE